MRFSQFFVPTLREKPAEAEVISHIYMLRGGFIRKLAAGIYSFLPLGVRVVDNISRIVREELNRAGALELLLPAVQPGELWKESNRWEQYGPELLRFQDRKKTDFVVGPTHEEVITDIVRKEVHSYRQLPINLYQIQTKFRDELRPRAGLMRGREFLMKDAYSFDVNEKESLLAYEKMYNAYQRIFTRCGLEFRPVEADTGNIGGSRSHEFQVLADSGEDAIVACNNCEYAANIEQAEILAAQESTPDSKTPAPLEIVKTPGMTEAKKVAAFLKLPENRVLKTMIYLADKKPIAVIVRADHEINELKLKKLLKAQTVTLASETLVKEISKAPVGFAGPVKLRENRPDLQILLDQDAKTAALQGAGCGANEADAHYVNAVLKRNFSVDAIEDLRQAVEGDTCPRCQKGQFTLYRGIEVGHVFYLGTKYSKPLKCNFLDEAGKEHPMEMGCYGIGITRTAAASIEQNHDEKGIIWPVSIAPFAVTILALQMDDPAVKEAALSLYQSLQKANIEVLLDDRSDRPGAKFADADLIGIPIRVILGKKGVASGEAELKLRRNIKEVEKISLETIADHVINLVKSEMAALTPNET